MNTGYPARTGVEIVDKLLARGGLMSMMETQLVAFTAFAFGGIMQKTGMLTVILGPGHGPGPPDGKPGRGDDRILPGHGPGDGQLLPVGHPARANCSGRSIGTRGLAAKNLSRIIDECGGNHRAAHPLEHGRRLHRRERWASRS